MTHIKGGECYPIVRIVETPRFFSQPWIEYLTDAFEISKKYDNLAGSNPKFIEMEPGRKKYEANFQLAGHEALWVNVSPSLDSPRDKCSLKISFDEIKNLKRIELERSTGLNSVPESRKIVLEYDSLAEGKSSITEERTIGNDKTIYRWDLGNQTTRVELDEISKSGFLPRPMTPDFSIFPQTFTIG
jgi:hypothetical protein